MRPGLMPVGTNRFLDTYPFPNSDRSDRSPLARNIDRRLAAVILENEGFDLPNVYYKYFRVEEADTPALLNKAYEIRYQVYCVENPFEDPSDNPDGLEMDEYDARAEHAVLVHRPTGLEAGTVRMVFPDPQGLDRSFALQEICDDPILKDRERFPVHRMGEVSRFCVTKNFRSRAEDLALKTLPANSEFSEDEWRRVVPNMTLGLIEWLVRVSVRRGLTHWCAVMEPKLLRLLTRLGIHFDPIGGLVDYHGRRQPCYIDLETFLERVADERPDVWKIISADGQHHEELRSVLI